MTLLAEEGYQAVVCDSLSHLVARIDDTTGALLMTEEALVGGSGELKTRLAEQAAWSDIPLILLAASRSKQPMRREASQLEVLNLASNSVMLERPLGRSSLISAVASALKSRQRQFEMRDRLLELENSRNALAESEAVLRVVTDSLPILIGFIDRDLVYRFANAAYREWFGVDPDEVVGRSVRDVVGDAAFAVRLQAMRAALAGETVRFELPWPHLDNRRREAEIRYLPRRGPDGSVTGFDVFVLDITDRKMTEEALSARVAERTAALEQEMASRTEAEEALRQSHKMEAVGQLTGGIAHDFNNMLTGVIGSLDIIRRRLETGRTQDIGRFMDAASASAQRAASLTARLLAFSRRQSLNSAPLDVNALAASLDDLLRRTLGETIALSIVPGTDVRGVVADANQLENAILNLAINARDAMPDGGRLTIRTSLAEIDETIAPETPQGLQSGAYVVISVSDTGTGISEAVLDKVFDPFFTTKPIGQGTGLGLSMVYGFARQSSGEVRIHSRVTEGTTVELYLPATELIRDEAPPPNAQSVQEGQGQTVLLVEDDPAVRQLVREVLVELRYEVLEAGSGDEALPLLSESRPIDLLVSDVGLPGMNGRQLAEIARASRPDLPILFVTGYAETAAVRGEFLGPNMDMVTKPFALPILASKISEMLNPITA